LAAALERNLRFEAQTDAEARAEMNANMPADCVDAVFNYFADGAYNDSAVVPTVPELTGRAPRTFERWTTAHADAFR
jgi:hypothetical protein